MRCVWQEQHGRPVDVLGFQERSLPSPRPSEVVVAVHAAPVLPMDNLRIRGLYPLQATLPGVPGSVGVGQVLSGPRAGAWVCLPMRTGSWATEVVVEADACLWLEPSVDPIQASLLRVNGLSAQAMLDGLEAESWVLFNAANGGVGRFLCSIARRMKLRTAAVVRRPEVVSVVDADVVLVDGPDLSGRLRAAGVGPVFRGLDGVGGAATARIGSALDEGGRVLHYGAMSRERPALDVSDLLFRGVLLQGFWLYRLDSMRGVHETQRLLNRLLELGITGQVDRCLALQDAGLAFGSSGRSVLLPQQEGVLPEA